MTDLTVDAQIMLAAAKFLKKTAGDVDHALSGVFGDLDCGETYEVSTDYPGEVSTITDPDGTVRRPGDPGKTTSGVNTGQPYQQSKYDWRVKPKSYSYSGDNAPWDDELAKRIKQVVDYRGSDFTKIYSELDADTQILVGALKSYTDVDVKNSGLIDRATSSPTEDDRRLLQQYRERQSRR